jgi:hypothetical protein
MDFVLLSGCEAASCPKVGLVDGETVLVQGSLVTDQALRAKMNPAGDEDIIAIPRAVFDAASRRAEST